MIQLPVSLPQPSSRSIDQAVAVLQRGGIIVFPTDTGYSMGCDLFRKKSIDRIAFVKRRDPKKPFTFICSDLKELSQFAIVSDRAYRDMRRLLPGPYTFVLPATKMVPKLLISSRRSVGIRVPDHAVPQAIVQNLRHPIISTSCVSPEGGNLTHPEEIARIYGKSIDLLLDGDIISMEPSTVIDFTESEPSILRKGKGSLDIFKVKEG
ncbi:MAG: threonylcarbamoyl-AMP synthase [Proteobacteria bacterium]|nr:threonylcarbamoyl-AMP synthase [Pseudomonadota bacterium]